METPAGEQAPPPVPMTRREARRLREEQEAVRRGAGAVPGAGSPDSAQADPARADTGPAAVEDTDDAVAAPSPQSSPSPGGPAQDDGAAAGIPPRPAAPPVSAPAAAASMPSAAPEERDAPEPAPAATVPRPTPSERSETAPEAPEPEPPVAASDEPQRDGRPRASHAEPTAAGPAHRHVQRDEEPGVGREGIRRDQPAGAGERTGQIQQLRGPEPEPAVAEAPAGFIRTTPVPPPGGLRGFLYRITGGALNLGPSEAERQEELLEKQIARRLEGNWNTAFLSLKGGIGKTSTTVGVGLTLAELRPEPPCAIDANPDAGDLVERALGEGAYESERRHSITSLLRDFGSVTSRADLMKYLHHAGSLHLLAGEQDPELSDSLTAEDYRRVHALVARHFTVTLTDCGTGVSRPAMRGILEDADSIVVVAGYAVSGAKRARDTLRWLSAHGYDRLAQGAIVVVTDKDDVSARVDRAAIEATLSGMCRALVTVPHDRSMADGDLVDLERLRPATRRAYRQIAAAIVSGYQR